MGIANNLIKNIFYFNNKALTIVCGIQYNADEDEITNTNHLNREGRGCHYG